MRGSQINLTTHINILQPSFSEGKEGKKTFYKLVFHYSKIDFKFFIFIVISTEKISYSKYTEKTKLKAHRLILIKFQIHEQSF